MSKSVKAELTLETAKKMYAQGGELRDFALDNFSEEELTELNWPKSWAELERVRGVWITNGSEIQEYGGARSKYNNRNVVPTRVHARSMRAFAMLSQLAAAMNGEVGWEDWDDWDQKKWVVTHDRDRGFQTGYTDDLILSLICFKTEEMAEFSLKHHRNLWEDYWMIK